MTDKTIIEAKLAAARQRHQAATTAVSELTATIPTLQRDFDLVQAEIQAAPHAPQELHIKRGGLKNQLYHAKEELSRQRTKAQDARIEAGRLQILAGGEQELVKVRERWAEASAAQVQAVKEAEAARNELARLDALLADALLQTEAAQQAQSSAILARLGFGKKPAPEVESAEGVLLGAAATAAALRSARPEVEATVAAADAKVAACDQVTRKAEQAILDVKQVMAEGQALLALEACQAAVHAYHVATLAAKNHFGDRFALYTSEDLSHQQQAQADQLRARAAVGE